MQKIPLWVACFMMSTAYAAGPPIADGQERITTDEQVSLPHKSAEVAVPISEREASTVDEPRTELDTLNKPQASKQKPPNTDSILTDSMLKTHVIAPETLKKLAQHAQWQHLLFYKNGKAEVISPGFYLSNVAPRSKRDIDPYAELIATIEQANDESTVCRYPARYLWLTHHLPELRIDLTACPQLPDADQEISLILVSSYLKNPASSFGHVLIKTSAANSGKDEEERENNKGDKEDVLPTNKNDKAQKTKTATTVKELSSEDLLNNSYNFGASIPADENGAMYALKGLFGLYDAGFSETAFFKQDAVYSKNEQRDMWEYVLNLGAFETQLLNYHLYEAKSARFDYYFIKQNCGYRSGELLELISDVKTTERIGPWYAPDYVFDQLVENKAASLVSSVRYLPSEQTQLKQKFVQLPKPIQRMINTVIRTNDTAPLATLNAEDRALVLDFLILYRTYQLSQDNTPKQQALKSELLRQRFALPASDRLAALSVPHKVSPALSNKTTQTKVTLSDDNAEVGLSLFVKDPLNTYTDIDKRFEAIQVSLGYDNNEDQWTLTEAIFLDMQQIEDLTQPLAGEPKVSWQLKTGARTDLFTGNHHSPYAQAGIGAGAKFGQHLLGYGMVNAAVHDQDKHADVGIEIGLRAKRAGRAAELSYVASKRENRDTVTLTTLTLRQQLSKNNDARIIVTQTSNKAVSGVSDSEVSAAWHHYW